MENSTAKEIRHMTTNTRDFIIESLLRAVRVNEENPDTVTFEFEDGSELSANAEVYRDLHN